MNKEREIMEAFAQAMAENDIKILELEQTIQRLEDEIQEAYERE